MITNTRGRNTAQK